MLELSFIFHMSSSKKPYACSIVYINIILILETFHTKIGSIEWQLEHPELANRTCT